MEVAGGLDAGKHARGELGLGHRGGTSGLETLARQAYFGANPVKERAPCRPAYQRPVSSPRDPLPPAVVALFLAIAGVEVVLSLAEAGLAGGPRPWAGVWRWCATRALSSTR